MLLQTFPSVKCSNEGKTHLDPATFSTDSSVSLLLLLVSEAADNKSVQCKHRASYPINFSAVKHSTPRLYIDLRI